MIRRKWNQIYREFFDYKNKMALALDDEVITEDEKPHGYDLLEKFLPEDDCNNTDMHCMKANGDEKSTFGLDSTESTSKTTNVNIYAI